MLQSLHVKNLAIVENIEVDFAAGLNVVTGETGAGKSIIIGALSLILGDRSDKSLIRAGADQCSVEAVFKLHDSSTVDAVLVELGLDKSEDGVLILRRTVSPQGSGKNLVNDSSTTLQALRQVGNVLVDMHGPHDHQSLLKDDFQLDLLDSFGHLWKGRSAYEVLYSEMIDIESIIKELDCDDQEVAQQIDMLSFQIKEIENADLTSEDDLDIEHEHTTSANATRILELTNSITQVLTEADTASFSSLVATQGALKELRSIVGDEVAPWQKEAEAIAIQLQELSASISNYASRIDADPERMRFLEDRMALIHGLKRKYGENVKEILAFLEHAKQRLHDLQTRGDRIAKMQIQKDIVRKQLMDTGSKLSEQRSAAGKKLSKAVTKELHDLGFKNGEFSIILSGDEPRPTGLDNIEFGFAPNVGEPMRSLSDIASSGEISRVMLATKAVLAKHDRIPVLIFDEIDTNIGGEMGNAIGSKLTAISHTHQLLCITHLPQVAIHGGKHFVVEKRVESGRTVTGITVVDGDARAEEVARMLGGADMTSVTLEHAREMLKSVK